MWIRALVDEARSAQPKAPRQASFAADGDHRNSPLSIVEIPHPVSVGPAV